jgi:hypothetical protein
MMEKVYIVSGGAIEYRAWLSANGVDRDAGVFLKDTLPVKGIENARVIVLLDGQQRFPTLVEQLRAMPNVSIEFDPPNLANIIDLSSHVTSSEDDEKEESPTKKVKGKSSFSQRATRPSEEKVAEAEPLGEGYKEENLKDDFDTDDEADDDGPLYPAESFAG